VTSSRRDPKAHRCPYQQLLAAEGIVEQVCIQGRAGAMAFTLTSFRGHSTASERVSETTPALLAAYSVTSLSATKLFREAMFTKRPKPTLQHVHAEELART